MTKKATNGRSTARGYKGVIIRKDLRLAIYLRDRFTCLYCLRDLHDAHPTDITDTPLSRFAGPETRAHIRRNTRRSIKRYRTLAKAIIAGETEDPRGNL
jgi:hypothetical protein